MNPLLSIIVVVVACLVVAVAVAVAAVSNRRIATSLVEAVNGAVAARAAEVGVVVASQADITRKRVDEAADGVAVLLARIPAPVVAAKKPATRKAPAPVKAAAPAPIAAVADLTPRRRASTRKPTGKS